MGPDDWAAEGRWYDVTVFSDVSQRDGLGWELNDLAPAPEWGQVLEIFREDSGPVPQISARALQPVPSDLRERFANAAVRDLLSRTIRSDRTDWLPTNIARGLSWVGERVTGWQGPEWPLTESEDGKAGLFAAPDADAVPFAWLSVALESGEVGISIYQDDAYFGLRFDAACTSRLSDYDPDYFKIHDDLPLPLGMIDSVTLTIDTSVLDDDAPNDAILTEAVISVGGVDFALIAAEAYGPDEWHRYDESVVVLRDVGAFDRVAWIPPRPKSASSRPSP